MTLEKTKCQSCKKILYGIRNYCLSCGAEILLSENKEKSQYMNQLLILLITSNNRE